jgi:hypothetical protein
MDRRSVLRRGGGLNTSTRLLRCAVNLWPLVPLEIPVGRPLPTQLDPNFSTAANEMVNGTSLYFRHSGFGWVGVIIPFDKLVVLHQALGAQIKEANSPGLGH